MAEGAAHYEAPEDMLVYLIGQTMTGSPKRRLSAAFILECLRIHRTPEETEACLTDVRDPNLADIASDVRKLASGLGLIMQS